MGRQIIRTAGFLAALVLAVSVAGQAYADDQQALYRAWLTHKGGYVTIGPCDSNPALACGHVSALSPDHQGPPPLDVNNKNPVLQDRPLLGLELISDFEYKGKGRWKDGLIYNTDDGKTYDSKLKLLDNGNLKVSGCVFFVCQSYEWSPAPVTAPALAE